MPFFCSLHPFLWLAMAVPFLLAGQSLSLVHRWPHHIMIILILLCGVAGLASALFGFSAAIHLLSPSTPNRRALLFFAGLLNFLVLVNGTWALVIIVLKS
jgi:hypothetical protein